MKREELGGLDIGQVDARLPLIFLKRNRLPSTGQNKADCENEEFLSLEPELPWN